MGKYAAICMYCAEVWPCPERADEESVKRIAEEAIAHDRTCTENPLVQRIAELEGLVRRLADELEDSVKAEYPDDTLMYPSQRRKFERDMSTVREARAALEDKG